MMVMTDDDDDGDGDDGDGDGDIVNWQQVETALKGFSSLEIKFCQTFLRLAETSNFYISICQHVKICVTEWL